MLALFGPSATTTFLLMTLMTPLGPEALCAAAAIWVAGLAASLRLVAQRTTRADGALGLMLHVVQLAMAVALLALLVEMYGMQQAG